MPDMLDAMASDATYPHCSTQLMFDCLCWAYYVPPGTQLGTKRSMPDVLDAMASDGNVSAQPNSTDVHVGTISHSQLIK